MALSDQGNVRMDQPTIAVVEAFVCPRPTSVRVARTFARAGSAKVLLCHWHRIEFSGTKVMVGGPMYEVRMGGEPKQITLPSVLPVEGMFFYGPDSGDLAPRDSVALDRLAGAGIDVSGDAVFTVVDRIMIEASRRGAVSNALGSDRIWGPKHLQELRLRRYETTTGEVIARPKTYIARPHEIRKVLSMFARRGETCLVKPVFGQGGHGILVVRPGDFLAPSKRTVVVQRLIPSPLLVEGHKADIRFYLLIDVNDECASDRVGPILVRRAAVPFFAGSLFAEITNTSYLLRLGLPPDVRLLDTVSEVHGWPRTHIITQLDSMARALVRAYFWNARNEPIANSFVSNRRLLFGVDALVATAASGPSVYFLELNPFPALFRGLPDCDQAVDEMLARECLPALVGISAP